MSKATPSDLRHLERLLRIQRDIAAALLDDADAWALCEDAMNILNNYLSKRILAETSDLACMQRAVLHNIDVERYEDAESLQMDAIDECELVLSLL
jgi:hypothetical protein